MSQNPNLARVAADLNQLERARIVGELDDAGRERRRAMIAELLRMLERGSGTERRTHLRIPADLHAILRVEEATTGCAASELSQSGLGLRGELWVDQGVALSIENLRVGSRDYPMLVHAKVVWKNATGAGILFLDLDQQAERQIRAVFEQLFWLYVERLAEG